MQTFTKGKGTGELITVGIKDDRGKPRYDLLPPSALHSVVDVLTHGAEKYGDDNWKEVDDANNRYFSACQRHLWAWKQGEGEDPDSGEPHLAHAICSLMFLLDPSLTGTEVPSRCDSSSVTTT